MERVCRQLYQLSGNKGDARLKVDSKSLKRGVNSHRHVPDTRGKLILPTSYKFRDDINTPPWRPRAGHLPCTAGDRHSSRLLV